MKTPSVVLVIVVCCGAAFAAGWLVRAPGSGERVDAERSDGTSEGMETSDPAKLDSTATRLVVAQKDLAEEKARHAETARELTELRARVEQGVLAEGAEGDA